MQRAPWRRRAVYTSSLYVTPRRVVLPYIEMVTRNMGCIYRTILFPKGREQDEGNALDYSTLTPTLFRGDRLLGNGNGFMLMYHTMSNKGG